MPNKFYHYYKLMRIGSPTGYLLVFFPAALGILMASKSLYDLRIAPLLFIGSILSRAAGCIINDMSDRKLDIHVERTKMRPMARGDINLREALFILYIVLFVCLAILLSLTVTATMVGFIAFCFILIYPLMKRITHFPQAFLGLTFNLGLLIGYAAIVDNVSLHALLMYVACCFWTIGYDTIYAFMDIKDDKAIGIKSTAVFFEKRSYRLWIMLFYAMFIILFININLINEYYISFFGGVLALFPLLWQVKTLNINDPQNCCTRFKSNIYVGLILVISMSVDCMGNIFSA